MKECIIIQYYVRDYSDEFILNKCIDSILKAGLDIFLISHSVISETIQKKVTYFFYDSDDHLLKFEDVYKDKNGEEHLKFNTFKYYNAEKFVVSTFLYVVDDLSYSFYKAVYDAYRVVNALGYDYSYYFVGDFIINENEIEKLKKVSKKVKNSDKKGLFYLMDMTKIPTYHRRNESHYISPFFWYVDNKWFLDNGFIDMSSKENYLKNIPPEIEISYESVLSSVLLKKKNDLIFEHSDKIGHPFVTEDRSDLSKKMKNSPYLYDIGVFYDIQNVSLFSLFSYNDSTKTKNWKVLIEYDDGTIDKHIVDNTPYTWTKKPIEIKYDKFNLSCYDITDKEIKLYDIYFNDIEIYKEKFKIEYR